MKSGTCAVGRALTPDLCERLQATAEGVRTESMPRVITAEAKGGETLRLADAGALTVAF